MAVVHHHQGVIFIRQVANSLQVRDVAVHGEYTVGGDHNGAAAGGLGGFQLGAQIFHVVIFVAEPLGLAQPHTVDDGGVVQLVGNNGILRPQQHFKQAAVGIEAGRIQNGIVHAQERCDLTFQGAVLGLGAADKADGG